MTLTPDKLAVIAARLEAATPGPWQADTSDPDDVVVWGPLPDSFIANVGDWTFHGEAPGQRAVVVDADGADAALIAHAPTDLAACLRHIAAQQERIEMWEDGLSECRSVHKLQAKVERLERVLAAESGDIEIDGWMYSGGDWIRVPTETPCFVGRDLQSDPTLWAVWIRRGHKAYAVTGRYDTALEAMEAAESALRGES